MASRLTNDVKSSVAPPGWPSTLPPERFVGTLRVPVTTKGIGMTVRWYKAGQSSRFTCSWAPRILSKCQKPLGDSEYCTHFPLTELQEPNPSITKPNRHFLVHNGVHHPKCAIPTIKKSGVQHLTSHPNQNPKTLFLWGTLPKRRPVRCPPLHVEQIICIDLWKCSSTIFWRPAGFLHWENAQQQHRHRHCSNGVQARGKHTQTCTQHRGDSVPNHNNRANHNNYSPPPGDAPTHPTLTTRLRAVRCLQRLT